MMTNRTFLYHVRTVVYYGGILLSVGLIWGGGLALLRGNMLEGFVAIVLGILLQMSLRRFGIDWQPEPDPDKDSPKFHDFVQSLDEGSKSRTPITEVQQDEGSTTGQIKPWNRHLQGTDGAILKGLPAPRLAASLVAIDDYVTPASLDGQSSGDAIIFLVDGERIVASCSRDELIHYIRRQSQVGGSR